MEAQASPVELLISTLGGSPPVCPDGSGERGDAFTGAVVDGDGGQVRAWA